MDESIRQALLRQLQAIAEKDHSVEAAERSVAAYRELAAEDPYTYTYRFGRNLLRLAERLEEAERLDEAAATADEALAIFRERAGLETDAGYHQLLAQALTVAAAIRLAAGDLAAARTLGEEGVATYRTAVARQPWTYRDGLAAALGIQSLLMLDADDPWAALTHAYEALVQVGLLDDKTLAAEPALARQALRHYEELCEALDVEVDEDRAGAVSERLARLGALTEEGEEEPAPPEETGEEAKKPHA